MEIDEIFENLTGSEKAKLFGKLAEDIFPVDSWTDREIKMLKNLGLLSWFGLKELMSDDDFWEGLFGGKDRGRKSRKDDWL